MGEEAQGKMMLYMQDPDGEWHPVEDINVLDNTQDPSSEDSPSVVFWNPPAFKAQIVLDKQAAKRLFRAIRKSANAYDRAVRRMKRDKEKERRRRLKGAST